MTGELFPPSPEALDAAAEALRSGCLVVVPTDTVYGVAVDPDNLDAVGRLYAAKGRGEEKPLQLLLPDVSWITALAEGLTPAARRLAEIYFPGPITLVVRRTARVPAEVVARGPTVGLRVPDHPVCLALLRAFGRPLAASSANRSGEPSPRTAAAAREQLGDSVALVLDAGPCPIGLESTVIDASGEAVVVLREGAVSQQEIMAALNGTAGPRR